MIRFTFTYLRPIALLLSIVVLFQCCKIYDKRPVSVEAATKNKIKRVKIITIDDRILVFDSIYYKEEKLYGMSKAKEIKAEVLIKEESIKEIHLYNSKKSITATVFLVLGSAWVFALLVSGVVLIIQIINSDGVE